MIVGIDLGTTNSLAAVWKDGEATLIPNAFGDYLTPSVVGLSDNGTILVGGAARDRLVTHPDMTVAAFKRAMGTEREFALGPKSFRAEELSALVLRSLKEDLETYLGEEVREAVISVPAYFNDTQRKATKSAGQLAGLTVERLVNEPTAAALAYGLHSNEDETQFLVFDLGGGTFDVSILELFDGIMEVRATAGDAFLGGEDFVDVLVEFFLERTRLDGDELSSQERGRLRVAAEHAKRDLNTADSTEITLRRTSENVACTIDRAEFSERVSGLLDRMKIPVQRSLRDSGIRRDELDDVILVGGATRMPLVQQLATKVFGRFPLRQVDPDKVVALGAAVQAGLKMRDSALDEIVKTDVCPYTLGIQTARQVGFGEYAFGTFDPIIERNTVVPTSRSKVYYPLEEGQSRLEIEVYQGESRRTSDNLKLGTLDVPLPDVPIEQAGVEIRFTYDINGLIEVIATTQHTGDEERLVIEQNPGLLSADEIDERLEALANIKLHPRADLQNQTVINRAKRLYEETLGDVREQIGMGLDRFLVVLDRQDTREIERARRHLSDMLDRAEEALQ
ncbi:MAG: molecular chaperone HscC [Myxococcota bacterium]